MVIFTLIGMSSIIFSKERFVSMLVALLQLLLLRRMVLSSFVVLTLLFSVVGYVCHDMCTPVKAFENLLLPGFGWERLRVGILERHYVSALKDCIIVGFRQYLKPMNCCWNC